VINNLNRYSKEIGANEELIALIINSLEDWDNKMQIECAQSFLAPLKDKVSELIVCDISDICGLKLLSKDNNQRLLNLSI